MEIDESAANAGMHNIRNDVTPDMYLALARRWIAAGASVVGGCCGIGPDHISALSADLSAS
jgi:S-methylmethionine-dependent homocysteine/selenocysteine methylase